MNIIQTQAEEFYKYYYHESGKYKEFLDKLRLELFEYHKDSHKLEFINRIIAKLRKDYDDHLDACKFQDDRLKCGINKNYENTLFFANNEREQILSDLESMDFQMSERDSINESLNRIISEINALKMGQELTYNDFIDQFDELKEYYFLSKKPWTQLLIGRFSEMVAGGLINETISKEIIEIVKNNYEGLIK